MNKLLQLIRKNANFTTAELSAMLGEPENLIKEKLRESIAEKLSLS